MNPSLYNTLLAQIEKMPVIDTHEHFWYDESDRIEHAHDVLTEYLFQYLRSDLISSGLKCAAFEQVMDPSGDIMDRWRIVEPYWNYCRHTGYCRALDIAVAQIYGINGIHTHTIEALSEAHQRNKRHGHHDHVLRDICNIEMCLTDSWTLPGQGVNPMLKYIHQQSRFIMPGGDTAIDAKHLDQWIDMMEADMDNALRMHNVRIIKSALAYSRSLRFDEVKYSEAKSLFNDAIKRPISFPKPLQDFMMHSLLRMANARNLTFQIHTGIQEGNDNTLANSDPSLLNNLFAAYPDVDFDLFHIGYPYQNVACALTKVFPNVTVDMCWAHIISPAASMAALDDFLDAIPFNKISAFGGDYRFVDGTCGHLQISRENVTRVLAKKVELGVFDEARALEIAHAMYYDNPKRIFKLDDN